MTNVQRCRNSIESVRIAGDESNSGRQAININSRGVEAPRKNYCDVIPAVQLDDAGLGPHIAIITGEHNRSGLVDHDPEHITEDFAGRIAAPGDDATILIK